MTKKSGFTLIELMIVIAIIAIITAIAIPNLIRSRISANEARAIGTLRTIVTAESQFKAAGTNISGGLSQFGNLNSFAIAVSPFLGAVIGANNTPTKSGFNFSFALGTSRCRDKQIRIHNLLN